jgi:hypothetical protein
LRTLLWAVGALLFAGALTACSDTSTSPGSGNANLYRMSATVAIPGVPPPAPTVYSFDISWVDAIAGQYYLADRTTNGVDVVNTANKTYILTAGKGAFTGVSIGGAANTGGPNGVFAIGGTIFAGDGNSTMKVLSASTGAVLATVPLNNPYTGPPLLALAGTQCNAAGTPTTGAGNLRGDELAYDPNEQQVLIIDDAACPAFGTFVSTNPPYNVLGSVAFTTANAGAEQPTWDPAQRKFLVAIPSTLANPGGEVDVIDPKTFAITATFPETNCNGNGTALGPGEALFIGCTNGGLTVMNATNGAVLGTIAGINGCDEVWFNPVANRFYAACSNNKTPLVAVVDALSYGLITTIGTSAGAHSVAVDPSSDTVYIPQRTPGVTTFGH